ncbi:hypothetical protein O4J56_19115 [Nocardiopsis sp. RSe5-2]|uniref:Uncharacterized protein n=1 Tax=Nocardiopsis endophytica TaxID=3018445 RepID=A0ABT4U8I4_9ACTN|nr:hypothetical protein [Nocardiopsis endophytica]MDA2812764.1 hypothetical protein [Nocardiopsis endophytica]
MSSLLRFLARFRVGIRTWILGTAAMLGISGDYIGTLDGSAWYQRGWMIAFGLVILAAHVGVEMLSSREDRRLARDLEEARDRLAESREELQELRGERRRLQRNVEVLKKESEVYRAELAAAARESDGLAWLDGPQGRAALDGLRDFADQLVDEHGAARSDRPARSPETRASTRPSLARAALRLAVQVAVGLLSAAFLALLVLGIEVYFD